MNKLPLNLIDLVPKETTFALSTVPGKAFTLCRWSLRVRAWAVEKYTTEALQLIFERQKIDEIADIVWFMLKDDDKIFFKGKKDEFLDHVVTVQDQINIIKGILAAIGIGEAEIESIGKSLGPSATAGAHDKAVAPAPKPKAPKKKIGAKSLTP